MPDLQPPPVVLSTGGASGRDPATAFRGQAASAPGITPPSFAATPPAGDPFALPPVAVLATERSASIPGSLPSAAVGPSAEQPSAMSDHPAFQPQMPAPAQVTTVAAASAREALAITADVWVAVGRFALLEHQQCRLSLVAVRTNGIDASRG